MDVGQWIWYLIMFFVFPKSVWISSCSQTFLIDLKKTGTWWCCSNHFYHPGQWLHRNQILPFLDFLEYIAEGVNHSSLVRFFLLWKDSYCTTRPSISKLAHITGLPWLISKIYDTPYHFAVIGQSVFGCVTFFHFKKKTHNLSRSVFEKFDTGPFESRWH